MPYILHELNLTDNELADMLEILTPFIYEQVHPFSSIHGECYDTRLVEKAYPSVAVTWRRFDERKGKQISGTKYVKSDVLKFAENINMAHNNRMHEQYIKEQAAKRAKDRAARQQYWEAEDGTAYGIFSDVDVVPTEQAPEDNTKL